MSNDLFKNVVLQALCKTQNQEQNTRPSIVSVSEKIKKVKNPETETYFRVSVWYKIRQEQKMAHMCRYRRLNCNWTDYLQALLPTGSFICIISC